MANSMTKSIQYESTTLNDIENVQLTKHNQNNESNEINKNQVIIKRKKIENSDLAPRFKYKTNYPIKDIQEIRKLLTLERENQNEDEYNFWTPDYKRMLKDDWLVTRFLLRGSKASQKYIKVDCKTKNGSSSDLDEDDENNNTDKDKLIYECTMQLVRSCAKFRRDYRINPETKDDEFPIEWLKVNGLFNHRPDLAGNPTIYLRICLHKPKLIETKEYRHEFKRLLLYTLEKCDQDLYNNMGKGVCCIFDMSYATFENVDLELASWMIKSFKSCSPKLLAYVIVYNLPWFFSATFKLLTTTLMSNSNKQCLKFVYGNEILKYVDYNNLPSYIRDSL